MLRHRVPTIFTLYMLDVLCCALGCVVLLWQVNYQEALDQSAAASDAAKEIATLKGEVSSLQTALGVSRKNEGAALLTVSSLSSDIKNLTGALRAAKQREALVLLQVADLRKERDKAQELALVTQKEYDQTKQALTLARDLLDNLRVDLKKLQTKQTSTAADLAAKIRDQEALLKKLKGTELRIVVLEKDLAARLLANDSTAKKVAELTAKLQESETNARKLEQTLASLQLLSKDYIARLKVSDVRAQLLETDLEKGKKEILEAAKRYQDLVYAQEMLAKRLKLTDKDLDEARNAISSLKGERLSLIMQALMLKEAAENRFAGIALTGHKVIFLIDMSGSMALLDTTTDDPEKWPELCDTVIKIMKSLPELKHYQVILFSDRIRYPLGSPGRWLEYSAETSAKTTLAALRATKPQGETNMHTAFEEAFAFRADGLDTIYVLSDGLPTAGPALPRTAVTESQKTEFLSKQLRQQLKNIWNSPGAAPGARRVRINTIGFFFESPEVGAFLWALAREHDGSFVGMR
jgi:hypothetical protein